MTTMTNRFNDFFSREELASRDNLFNHSIWTNHPLILLPRESVFLWRTFDDLDYLREFLLNPHTEKANCFNDYVYNHQIPKVPVIRGGEYEVRELSPVLNWYIHLFEVPYHHPTYGRISAWSTTPDY